MKKRYIKDLLIFLFSGLVVVLGGMVFQHNKVERENYEEAAKVFYHNLHHADLYLQKSLNSKEGEDQFTKHVHSSAMWLKGTVTAYRGLRYEAAKEGIAFNRDVEEVFVLTNLDQLIDMKTNSPSNLERINSLYEEIHKIKVGLNDSILLHKKPNEIQKAIHEVSSAID
ncbi:hypothetical protein [Pontibacillus marinus]|uniref:hypothetical protein n=1 Tax=Pontibacillus marinus TaxID=273164 RepID=UPI0004117F0F|nr:hypothetical protein [Pontibacillus marinus]